MLSMVVYGWLNVCPSVVCEINASYICYWAFRRNSLELNELSNINKLYMGSLVEVSPCSNTGPFNIQIPFTEQPELIDH
jgi:hypothetical protein